MPAKSARPTRRKLVHRVNVQRNYGINGNYGNKRIFSVFSVYSVCSVISLSYQTENCRVA
jgi:hypothetical protein